jgi:hypothetical protein
MVVTAQCSGLGCGGWGDGQHCPNPSPVAKLWAWDRALAAGGWGSARHLPNPHDQVLGLGHGGWGDAGHHPSPQMLRLGPDIDLITPLVKFFILFFKLVLIFNVFFLVIIFCKF